MDLELLEMIQRRVRGREVQTDFKETLNRVTFEYVKIMEWN